MHTFPVIIVTKKNDHKIFIFGIREIKQYTFQVRDKCLKRQVNSKRKKNSLYMFNIDKTKAVLLAENSVFSNLL